jgi:very-short-patch-repair endonuclease
MQEEIPRSVMRRFAREQRANAVQAESLIWAAVRNRRCEGWKFQRQVALGRFLVDFICFERRVIVEIDGPSHESEQGKAADAARDVWLCGEGFRVVRLPNELVIGSTELVVAGIRAALAK